MTIGSRRRAWITGLACFVALAVSAAVGGSVFGSQVKSPAQAAAEARPPTALLVTAKLERRTIADSLLVRATVVAGEAKTLHAPDVLGDAAVVTEVVARRGDWLAEGAVLFEVAGEPMFGLATPFPLYRDIGPGMTGPDVREVQSALERLGYPLSRTATFDQETQDALARFYRDRGTAEPAAMLERSHVVWLDKARRTVSAVPVKVGSTLQPGAPILRLDLGAPTVTATVGADQVGSVRKGAPARVDDEVRGVAAAAVVTTVGREPVATDDGSGYQIGLEFTGKALPATPNHTVRVTIGESRESAAVLAAPVTAISTAHDGSTSLTVDTGAGGASGRPQTTEVEVEVGAVAGGWVAVRPVSRQVKIAPGTEVVVGVRAAGQDPAGQDPVGGTS